MRSTEPFDADQTPPHYGAIFFLLYFLVFAHKYFENKSFTPLSLRHRIMWGGYSISRFARNFMGGGRFLQSIALRSRAGPRDYLHKHTTYELVANVACTNPSGYGAQSASDVPSSTISQEST